MIKEKRKFPRIASKAIVHVERLADTEESLTEYDFESNLKDFSATGVRLHGKNFLAKDETLKLVVELQDSDSCFNLLGNVKWTTNTTENEHIMGIALSESKSQDIERWKEYFR